MSPIVQEIQTNDFSTAEWNMLVTLVVFFFYGSQFTYPSLYDMAKRQSNTCCTVWTYIIICIVTGGLNLTSMFLFWRLGRMDDSKWQVGMAFYLALVLFMLPWPVLYAGKYRLAALACLVMSLSSGIIAVVMYFILDPYDAGAYLLLPFLAIGMVCLFISIFDICLAEDARQEARRGRRKRINPNRNQEPEREPEGVTVPVSIGYDDDEDAKDQFEA